jgi:tRNA 5-methylaminomethyl-2-thiouridine biosynthesis bifunctional protein
MFDHHWCGVTQLGWDEKARKKSPDAGAEPAGDRRATSRRSRTAGVETGCGGITYPPAAGCARS